MPRLKNWQTPFTFGSTIDTLHPSGTMTIDPMGIATVEYFDSLGRQIQTEMYSPTSSSPGTFAPLSATYYNSFGDPTSKVNAVTQTTAYTYDFDNRQTDTVESVQPGTLSASG